MTLLWRRHGRLAVILPLIATLGVSILLFVYANRQEEEAVRKTFEDRARPLASAIRESCDSHLEVLRSLNALFSSIPAIHQEEFVGFVAKPLRLHPGIRGLSWDPLVKAADRARFEAETGVRIIQVDRQGRRIPAAPAAEYVVVHYIEPTSDRPAQGFDVSSEPVRREAQSKARDTGEIAATGPIHLINDSPEQRSVLLFAPVYGVGTLPATLERRRREIRGYATGAFRLSDLVETAIRNLPRKGLTVALFDNRNPAAPERLYGGAGTGGWCRGVCRSVAPPSTKIAKPPWGFLFLGGP